jgi:transcriptional regulator with XRE-family HTH domain
MAARSSGSDRPSRIARQSPRFASEVRALGQRVRALRDARDWTLEQAAEATNLDLKHFQKIEAGKLNVTLVTLVRLAEGFGEPMATLFKPSRGSQSR